MDNASNLLGISAGPTGANASEVTKTCSVTILKMTSETVSDHRFGRKWLSFLKPLGKVKACGEESENSIRDLLGVLGM